MKAVTIILLAMFTLATAACGKDDGIPATFHEKAKPTPPSVEEKALNLLPNDIASNSQSASSYHIRANLIGINMNFSKATESSTKLSITLSQTHGNSTTECDTRTFSGEFDNSTSQQWVKIDNLGRMICLDNRCAYAMLVIEQSDNQVATAQGVDPAAVPVILEDRSGNTALSAGDYLPTTSESSYFLRLTRDTNIQCNDPAETKHYTAPVLPDEDTGVPDYTYFPINDYNTWF